MKPSSIRYIICIIGLFLAGIFLRAITTKYVTFKVRATMERASNDVEFLASFLPIVCDFKEMEAEVASLEVKGHRLEQTMSNSNFTQAIGEVTSMLADVEDIYDQVKDIKEVVENAEAYDEQTRKVKQDILRLINLIDTPVQQAVTLKNYLLNGRLLISIGVGYQLYNSLSNLEQNYTNGLARLEKSMEAYTVNIEDNFEMVYGEISIVTQFIMKVVYFGKEVEVMSTILFDEFTAVAMGSSAFSNAYHNGCLETTMEELKVDFIEDMKEKHGATESKGARIDDGKVQGLNVRSSCDFSNKANKLFELTTASRFKIIDETNSCYQILYKGKKGYVSKKYVVK